MSGAALVGRSFDTRVSEPESPIWGPLEAVARVIRSRPELPAFHTGEFMFMATVACCQKPLRIHLYKHIDTRRYLNLDDGGHAYAYRDLAADRADTRTGGRYQRYRTLVDAIEHLELWLFEIKPQFFRSFPPEEWPPPGQGIRRRSSSGGGSRRTEVTYYDNGA